MVGACKYGLLKVVQEETIDYDWPKLQGLEGMLYGSTGTRRRSRVGPAVGADG